MGKLLRALAVLGGGYALYRMARDRQKLGGMIKVDSPEEAFLKDAALAELEAIRLGNIAQQQGSDAELRQISALIPEAHTHALGRLRDLAARHHIKLPNVLPDRVRRTEEQLYGLSGEAFDRAFIERMLNEHEKVIAQLHGQLPQTRDEQIRRYIEDALPRFEGHASQLRRVAERMAIGTRAAG